GSTLRAARFAGMLMNQRRRVSFSPITSMLVASTLTLTGCVVSSTEVINTDRTYLLGPKTESVPGPPKRDVTTRALDTGGMIAFHLDRARECTVTSTPRFQRVHIEGKVGKNIAGAVITGSALVAAGGAMIALTTVIGDGSWTKPSSTGGGSADF